MKKMLLFLLSVSLLGLFPGSGSFAFADDARQVIDISGHPVKGPASAPVTIIVFSDYLCPACEGIEPVIRQVMEKNPHDVKLVHKLCPVHDFSREAVAAAYAAWDQGKFWEYHDLLFYNRLVLNKPKVTAMAKELHLDLKRFNRKMKDPAIGKLIERDMADVYRLNLVGTPTVFINGKLLDSHSVEAFQTAINLELGKKP